MPLLLDIGNVLEKNGNIVVRIRMCITARSRPEQDYTLHAVAVYCLARDLKSRQHGIIGRRKCHLFLKGA